MKKALVIIWLASVLIAFFAVKYAIKQREQKITAQNNLHVTTTEFETNSGKLANQVTELQVTTRELRSAARKDSAIRNEYEQKLAHANSVIRDLNIKLRNVESANSIEIESSKTDTVYYRVDSIRLVKISDIHTPYFDAVFKPVKDSMLLVSHTYHSNVDIVISRERGRKLDETKRFIICRLIFPKWRYSATVVAEDPDAKISSNDYIRFKKR